LLVGTSVAPDPESKITVRSCAAGTTGERERDEEEESPAFEDEEI